MFHSQQNFDHFKKIRRISEDQISSLRLRNGLKKCEHPLFGTQSEYPFGPVKCKNCLEKIGFIE